MNDIVISRCDLQVRRPAGTVAPWLSESDHRATAKRVQQIVLPMIEEILAPQLNRNPDAVPAALSIDLSLTHRDLIGAAPLARPALRARLGEAIEVAFAASDTTVPRTATEAKETPPQPDAPNDLTLQSKPDILAYLGVLFSDGTRSSALQLLSKPVLKTILFQVLRALDAGSPAQSAIVNSAANAVAVPDATTPQSITRDKLIEILASLAQAFAQHSTNASSGSSNQSPRLIALAKARELAALIRAIPAQLPSEEAGIDPSPPVIARAQDPLKQTLDVSIGSSSEVREKVLPPDTLLAIGRHRLDHALPFLALAALSRRGISQALPLDMDGAVSLQALVGAVALKCVLPEKSGGAGAWAPGAWRAAQLASGLQNFDGAALKEASSHVLVAGSFARAAVGSVLLDNLSRTPTLPLVFMEDTLTLFDAGGLYPVMAGGIAEIAPVLATLGRRYFISPADPEVWQKLAALGLALVGEGPALRDQDAVPIAGPAGWQGHGSLQFRASFDLKTQLPFEAQTARRAQAVWHALSDETRLTPQASTDAQLSKFDELAAILAGFALADIGWRLLANDADSWSDPDPLLVRDRFADLSGWLDVTITRITIVLPLGRRFSDLQRAGLLDTIDALPWTFGRQISFQGS